MEILNTDIKDFYDYLKNKRYGGFEFVAYCTTAGPINPTKIETFTDHYDALEFCHENDTDVDHYSLLSTRAAYRVLSKLLSENPSVIEKPGTTNIAALVDAYYQALQSNELSHQINNNVMNQKNFEFLRDQVKYTGFGDGLENAIKKGMEENKKDFSLPFITTFGKDEVNAQLHFNQSEKSGMYFFNSYSMSVKPEYGQSVDQLFYIGKNNNITLKEAFNLLSGRAVNKDLTNKEGELYNAWIQLDFKQSEVNGNFKTKHFHDNYGFKLEEALAKHPIKELLNDSYKENLLESLRKGNVQSVTFIVNNTEQKHFVEANPQFKTVNVYDSQMKRVNIKHSKGENEREGEGMETTKAAKKENQQSANNDDADSPAKKKNVKKQGQSI